MKVTKELNFTVNMGDYESMRIGASVALDSADYPDFTEEDLFSEADRLLAEALAPEIKLASDLTNKTDSFILSIGK